MTYKPDDIIFDGETEPTTESTTLAAAMSITVSSIVGLLVIFVGAFCVWLLYGIYCKGTRRGTLADTIVVVVSIFACTTSL